MSELVEIPRLRKNEYAALEKVFAAEIENRLPFQSRAKIFKQLADDDLLEFVTGSLGRDRFGSLEVSGYTLTHAGRWVFCAHCSLEDL